MMIAALLNEYGAVNDGDGEEDDDGSGDLHRGDCKQIDSDDDSDDDGDGDDDGSDDGVVELLMTFLSSLLQQLLIMSVACQYCCMMMKKMDGVGCWCYGDENSDGSVGDQM